MLFVAVDTAYLISGCHMPYVDLKPENLLFRTKDEDADIMIADFGLSRVMDDEKFHLLTEICGTPGVRPPISAHAFSHLTEAYPPLCPQYMAPEIFKKSGLCCVRSDICCR